jgi:ferredoxin
MMRVLGNNGTPYSFLHITIIVIMAHKKQGYRFDNDWPYERLKENSEKLWKSATTIPVNVEIAAEHRVLNLEKAKEYLSKANLIVLLDCICRTYRNNCDNPLNVCVDLDDLAERDLTNEDFQKLNPRIVTKEEALDALAKSHEAGLVHMAYALGVDNDPDHVNAICSCCSCCCAILSATLRYGLAPHLLTSDTVSQTDSSKCTACGVCVDRCQFGAREIVDGSLNVDYGLCFGCSSCSITCPTGAVSIVDK